MRQFQNAGPLERAYELAPTDSDVANNLAFVLAESDSQSLPRALKLVNSALAQHPDKVAYLETRAQILAKLAGSDQ